MQRFFATSAEAREWSIDARNFEEKYSIVSVVLAGERPLSLQAGENELHAVVEGTIVGRAVPPGEYKLRVHQWNSRLPSFRDRFLRRETSLGWEGYPKWSWVDEVAVGRRWFVAASREDATLTVMSLMQPKLCGGTRF